MTDRKPTLASGVAPDRPQQRIVRADELERWLTRDRLIERAQADAESIRLAAREEVERAHRQRERDLERRRADGFEAGRRDGEVEAARQLQQTSERLQRYLGGMESTLASFSLDIVRRILGTFGDAELLSRCVRHALTELQTETALVIRVAPSQVESLGAALSATHQGTQPLPRVEADAALEPMQCLLVSANTVVEIGPEAQLAVIGQTLGARDASP